MSRILKLLAVALALSLGLITGALRTAEAANCDDWPPCGMEPLSCTGERVGCMLYCEETQDSIPCAMT